MEQDPRNVPPAIAAFLAEDLKVTEDVLRRTLLALADRGWLAIEPTDDIDGNGGGALVRLGTPPVAALAELLPFERLALDRAQAKLRGVPAAPLSALTSNDGNEYDDWRGRFDRTVTTTAARLGLIRERIRPLIAAEVSALLAAAGGFAVSKVDDHSANSSGPGIFAGFVIFIVLEVILGQLQRWRPTAQGAAVAAWWRTNGGELGSGSSTRSARTPGSATPADQIPFGAQASGATNEALVARGTEPLPPGYAWSSLGGRWRAVKVGPHQDRIAGRPATAVVTGLAAVFFTFPATVVGRFVIGGADGTLLSAAPLAVFALGMIFGWLPANRRRQAVPNRVAFLGQVIKRWSYETGGEDSSTIYCLCIDDGSSPEGWSCKVKTADYREFKVGDTVAVELNPRWNKTIRISRPK